MLNPSFLQVETQDGEMRLQPPRLDRADPRMLDDLGLSDAEWASASGNSRPGVIVAAFLARLRQSLMHRPPRETAAGLDLSGAIKRP